MFDYKSLTRGQTGSQDPMDKTRSNSTLVEEDAVETSCGYSAKCAYPFLQHFAHPRVFLVIISLFAIVQGFSVNGINNVNISTYERRFLLTSKNSGLVASMYDIAAGALVLFVGYFGGRSHQPRLLTAALLAQFLGNFIMSMAHFISPMYQPSLDSTGLTCQAANSTAMTCDLGEDQSFLKNYLYVLLLGQALNGFAGTTLYTIGVTYLDESVPAESSPVYIGIMAAMSVFGPAMGYIFGGYLLNIYVDAPNLPSEGLVLESPSWVGAWWIGFVISSILSLLLAFIMLCFPKELPKTASIRAQKVSQAHDNGTEEHVNRVDFGLNWRDMPKATWYLIRNPSFVCITVVAGMELMLAAGFSTFLPKFISNQFHQTTSWAGILTGLLAVPGAAAGQLIGGFLCKRFKLKVPGMLKMITVFSIIVACLTPVFWVSCPDADLAGIKVQYPQSDEVVMGNLTDTCNKNCGCDQGLYDPVCVDGVQMFNPCYAGCPAQPITDDTGNTIYANCTCAPINNGTKGTYMNVTAGQCETSCNTLNTLFVPFVFLVFFFTFMMATPLTVATLRVVPEKQRAFAVAVQWVFVRFAGSIPGPLLFGAIIDSSCRVWDEDCEVRGSCWIYSNYSMSLRLFILVVIIKVVSIIFTILGFLLYKPPSCKEPQVTMSDVKASNNGVHHSDNIANPN